MTVPPSPSEINDDPQNGPGGYYPFSWWTVFVNPLTLAILIALAVGWFLGGWHLKSHPTQDQLYGCTVAQQAPNGECK